jgi:hypothetical protein
MIPRDWVGCPAVVIASGPSLCQEDVDYCRGKAKLVVVNDCWRLAPWADALYAADLLWWDHYSGVPDFTGEKWTNSVSADAGTKYGVQVVKIETKQGFSSDPELIHRLGGNGGGQAVNLALLRGAAPVVMLGFDMQATGSRKHWFGDHPGRLNRLQSFVDWVSAMDAAAPSAPVPVINCSRVTALKSYPRMPLAQCLPASP